MIKFFRHIRKSLLMENKTSKYFKYAIGEIVLVVIGILIALQVNNWNETRLEQKKISQYAKSLIEDLKSDIDMMMVSQFQADKKYRHIDSLRTYLNQTPLLDLSNTFIYTVAHDVMYRPYKWNRSTLNELKNSGAMSYITNDSLQKKIVAYESFSYHLDEDFEFDKTNSDEAERMMTLLLNLNSIFITNLLLKENEYFNDSSFNVFESDVYAISKENDVELISYDESLIHEFINTYIIIQDNYRIRAFKEMPEIIQDAEELITLLEQEYNLN